MRKIRNIISDPQRGKLYSLEREIEGICVGHQATRAFLQKLSRKTCNLYNVPPVRLKFIHEPKSSEFGYTIHYGDPEFDSSEVVLNSGYHGRNSMTLLHELTHHIVDCHFENVQAHGPEFCAIYMYLLDRNKLLPQDCFRLMARRWKIRVSPEFLPSTFS